MELVIQGKSLFQKDIELFDSNNILNTKGNNDKNVAGTYRIPAAKFV